LLSKENPTPTLVVHPYTEEWRYLPYTGGTDAADQSSKLSWEAHYLASSWNWKTYSYATRDATVMHDEESAVGLVETQ